MMLSLDAGRPRCSENWSGLLSSIGHIDVSSRTLEGPYTDRTGLSNCVCMKLSWKDMKSLLLGGVNWSIGFSWPPKMCWFPWLLHLDGVQGALSSSAPEEERSKEKEYCAESTEDAGVNP
jgi:hypothetical protein